VNDFAAYFEKASSENLESLDLLIKVIPSEKWDIKLLLEIVSDREQEIARMANILKHHGRIIRDRG
jgi:citrate lyase gamma subunit